MSYEHKEENVIWGLVERTYHRVGCPKLGHKPTAGPLGYAVENKNANAQTRFPCQECKPATGKYHFMWHASNKLEVYHWQPDCPKLLTSAKFYCAGEEITSSIVGERAIAVTQDLNFCDHCRPKRA